MNSSHSSKLVVLAVLLAVVAAGPAAAVSVSGADAPTEAETGSTVDVTFTIEDLYTKYDQYSLEGETGLVADSVTWTVTTYDLGDDKIEERYYNGSSFSQSLAKGEGIDHVTVRIEGTVPEWDDWSYDPPQTMTVATFSQSAGGDADDIQTIELRPYNQQSQSARESLEAAKSAIETANSAGVDVSQANSDMESAVSSFNNGNFENAEKLAGDAQDAANSAQQSSQMMSTVLLIGGVIVVLAIIAGLGYWYLSNRETYDKLG